MSTTATAAGKPVLRLQGNMQYKDQVKYPSMSPYLIVVKNGDPEKDLPAKEQVLAAAADIFGDDIEVIEYRTRENKKKLVIGLPRGSSRDEKDALMANLN